MKTFYTPLFFALFALLFVPTVSVDAEMHVGHTCEPLVSMYMSVDRENDPSEVLKLQQFLREEENLEVPYSGEFDFVTEAGVKVFQDRYAEDILAPWGLEAGDATGIVFFTTQQKINQIHCGEEVPLTSEQLLYIEQSKEGIIPDPVVGSVQGATTVAEAPAPAGQISATSTAVVLTLEDAGDPEALFAGSDAGVADGEEEEVGPSVMSGAEEQVRKIAAAALTMPDTPRELVFYGLWLILILALVYIVGSLVAGLKDVGNVSEAQVRMRKIIYFIVGALIGLVASVLFNLTVLVVPLIVVIVALVVGLLFYSRKKTHTAQVPMTTESTK